MDKSQKPKVEWLSSSQMKILSMTPCIKVSKASKLNNI